MLAATPSARVVVVEYNGADVLSRCIDSLLQTVSADIPITIIDNHSPTPAESIIPDDHKNRVDIVRLDKNTGYAGAIAEAWSLSREDFIVIANNDLEFTPGWLDELLKMAVDRDAHAVSAVIEEENESEPEKSTNASLSPLLYLIPGVFRDRTKAVYPSGACFLLRRDPEFPRPPVDPEYFLYYEDVYIGFLLRSLGKTVVQCPDARVRHVGSHSVKKSNPNRIAFLQERNRWMTQLLFFDAATLFDFAPFTGLDWLLKIPQCWIRRKPVFATIAAHWWVWFHMRSILRKRKAIRELPDFDCRRILGYLTPQLIPSNLPCAGFVNSLSKWWINLTGVPAGREAEG